MAKSNREHTCKRQATRQPDNKITRQQDNKTIHPFTIHALRTTIYAQ